MEIKMSEENAGNENPTNTGSGEQDPNNPAAGTGGENEQTPPGGTDDPNKSNDGKKDGSDDGSDIPTVKGEDGVEYIPKDAFDKRVGKLVGQRNDMRDFLEGIKSDPQQQQEFLEAIGAAPKQPPKSEPIRTELDEFLDPYPKETQSFLRKYTSSFMPEIERFVNEKIEATMNPVRRYIGKTEIESFSGKVNDFQKYEEGITKRMSANSKLTLDEAYKLESYDDRFNQGKKSAGAKNQQKTDKQTRTPITGKTISGANTKRDGKMSIEDGITNAIAQHEGRK